MATKMKYGKGVLTIVSIPLLLNSSDLPSYDSESGEMHTKAVVDVSKHRGRGRVEAGFWNLLYQGEMS